MRYDQELKIKQAAEETRRRRRRQEEAARAKEEEAQREALAALEVRKTRRTVADQYLRKPGAPPPQPANPNVLRRGAGLARFYGVAPCSASLSRSASPSRAAAPPAAAPASNAVHAPGSSDAVGANPSRGRSRSPQRAPTSAPPAHLQAAASAELDSLLATARGQSDTHAGLASTSGARKKVVFIPTPDALAPHQAAPAPPPVPAEPPHWVTLTARLAHSGGDSPSGQPEAASLAQVLTRPGRLSTSRQGGNADVVALSSAPARVSMTSSPQGAPPAARMITPLQPPPAPAQVVTLHLAPRQEAPRTSVSGARASHAAVSVQQRYSDRMEVAAQKAIRASTPPLVTRQKSLDEVAEAPMLRAGSYVAAMQEVQARRQRDEQRRVAAARAEAAARQREKQAAEEALVRAAAAQVAAQNAAREARDARRVAAHHTAQAQMQPLPPAVSRATPRRSSAAAPAPPLPPLSLFGAWSDEEAQLIASLAALDVPTQALHATPADVAAALTPARYAPSDAQRRVSRHSSTGAAAAQWPSQSSADEEQLLHSLAALDERLRRVSRVTVVEAVPAAAAPESVAVAVEHAPAPGNEPQPVVPLPAGPVPAVQPRGNARRGSPPSRLRRQPAPPPVIPPEPPTEPPPPPPPPPPAPAPPAAQARAQGSVKLINPALAALFLDL